MSGNTARILINENGSFAIIEHESSELLEYDDENLTPKLLIQYLCNT